VALRQHIASIEQRRPPMAAMTYYVALGDPRMVRSLRASRKRPEAQTKRSAWPARWRRWRGIAGPSRFHGPGTRRWGTSRMR
jgi:hypothetical protein